MIHPLEVLDEQGHFRYLSLDDPDTHLSSEGTRGTENRDSTKEMNTCQNRVGSARYRSRPGQDSSERPSNLTE